MRYSRIMDLNFQNALLWIRSKKILLGGVLALMILTFIISIVVSLRTNKQSLTDTNTARTSSSAPQKKTNPQVISAPSG